MPPTSPFVTTLITCELEISKVWLWGLQGQEPCLSLSLQSLAHTVLRKCRVIEKPLSNFIFQRISWTLSSNFVLKTKYLKSIKIWSPERLSSVSWYSLTVYWGFPRGIWTSCWLDEDWSFCSDFSVVFFFYFGVLISFFLFLFFFWDLGSEW